MRTTFKTTVAATVGSMVLLTAACGGGGGDETSAADGSPTSTTAATTASSTAVTTAETTTGEETAETTADVSGADRTEPVSEEQPWWPLLRKSRTSDLAHLEGDLERSQGQPSPVVLEPGTYTTNQLGTPITLTLPVPLALAEENPGFIIFPRPGPQGSGVLLLARPVGVFVGDQSVNASVPEIGRLAAEPVPENLGDWFDQVDAITVSDQSEAIVDGLDVTRYELAIDADLAFFCAIGQCVNTLAAGPTIAAGFTFNPDQRNVVWEIEQPGTDIVIIAKADEENNAPWFDVVEDIIASFEFGQPAKSPIEDQVWDLRTQLPPGDYSFAGVDWIRFNVGQDVAVNTSFNYLDIGPVDVGYSVSLAKILAPIGPIGLIEGGAVSTAEDGRALLVDTLGDGAVTELGTESLLGYEALAVRLTAPDGPQLPLFYYAPPIAGERWETAIYFSGPDESTQLWIIERPDGVWVAALSWSDPGDEADAKRFAEELFSNASVIG